MASDRECRIIDCGFGRGTQIVCAARWLWIGGDGWACIFGRHVLSKTGGNGGTLYHAASKTYVSVYPQMSARGLEIQDTGVEPPATDQTTTAFLGVGALYIPLIMMGILLYIAFKGK